MEAKQLQTNDFILMNAGWWKIKHIYSNEWTVKIVTSDNITNDINNPKDLIRRIKHDTPDYILSIVQPLTANHKSWYKNAQGKNNPKEEMKETSNTPLPTFTADPPLNPPYDFEYNQWTIISMNQWEYTTTAHDFVVSYDTKEEVFEIDIFNAKVKDNEQAHLNSTKATSWSEVLDIMREYEPTIKNLIPKFFNRLKKPSKTKPLITNSLIKPEECYDAKKEDFKPSYQWLPPRGTISTPAELLNLYNDFSVIMNHYIQTETQLGDDVTWYDFIRWVVPRFTISQSLFYYIMNEPLLQSIGLFEQLYNSPDCPLTFQIEYYKYKLRKSQSLKKISTMTTVENLKVGDFYNNGVFDAFTEVFAIHPEKNLYMNITLASLPNKPNTMKQDKN